MWLYTQTTWCKHRHTHVQVAQTLIEQSKRPRRTGFRFPWVQWAVPPPFFRFSWLVILCFLISTQGWSSSQDPLLLVIVSGAVNRLFLWLGASFTHAEVSLQWKFGKEAWESAGAPTGLPGRGQSPLAHCCCSTVTQIDSLNSYALGKTWHGSQSRFHTDEKKHSVQICVVVIVVCFPFYWLSVCFWESATGVCDIMSGH